MTGGVPAPRQGAVSLSIGRTRGYWATRGGVPRVLSARIGWRPTLHATVRRVLSCARVKQGRGVRACALVEQRRGACQACATAVSGAGLTRRRASTAYVCI